MTNLEQFEADHDDFGTLSNDIELNIAGELKDMRDWTEEQWPQETKAHEPRLKPLNFDDVGR